MLIFEHSAPGRRNIIQAPNVDTKVNDIPAALQRKKPPALKIKQNKCRRALFPATKAAHPFLQAGEFRRKQAN